MKRIAICLVVICALALAGVAVKAADQAKVAGNWEMTSAGRGGNPSTSTIKFEQDGTKIKGTITRQGPNGPMEIPFTGTVDGNKITFTTEFTTPDGTKRTTEYTGTVDGDNIKGTMKTGQGEREWSAKRTK